MAHNGKFIDKTGWVFGRLTVIRFFDNTPHGKKESRWLCKCECGSEAVIKGGNLTSGCSKSCGCLRKEVTRKTHTTHGFTAGGITPKEYEAWLGMKDRCYNPKYDLFHRYGGRGIVVCKRWLGSFQYFYDDVGKSPPGMSLHRINNDGNYEPGNVKWATGIEQSNCTSRNHYIELGGRRQTASQWSRELGIKPGTILTRLGLGWNAKDALTLPLQPPKLRQRRA